MDTNDKLKYLIAICESNDESVSSAAADRQLHNDVGAVVDVDAEVKAITEAAVALGKRDVQHALFAQLVDFMRRPPDDGNAVSPHGLQALDVNPLGGWTSEDSYIPRSYAATQEAFRAPVPQDQFGIDGDHVYFQCAQTDLPSGLCYIALVQPAKGTVTMLLVRLKLIGGAWHYRSSLLAALKDEPTSKVEAKYVLPANEKTRTVFESPEVVEFVRGLPEDDVQYVAAANFLGWKGGKQ